MNTLNGGLLDLLQWTVVFGYSSVDLHCRILLVHPVLLIPLILLVDLVDLVLLVFLVLLVLGSYLQFPSSPVDTG